MRSVGAGRTCPAELRAARRASGPAQAREIARRGRITCVRHRPGAHEFGGLLEARPSPFYTQSENALAALPAIQHGLVELLVLRHDRVLAERRADVFGGGQPDLLP